MCHRNSMVECLNRLLSLVLVLRFSIRARNRSCLENIIVVVSRRGERLGFSGSIPIESANLACKTI